MQTPEHRKKIEEFRKAGEKMATDLKNSKWYKDVEAYQNSEGFKQAMAITKNSLEEATRKVLEQRNQVLEQVKLTKEANKVAIAELKRLTAEGKFDSLKNYNSKSDSLINYSGTIYFNSKTDKNSKVKIKKHIKLKVPKNAVLNLNVRHGKVNIPEFNNKMSVNMNYGNFTGGIITGIENNLTFINTSVAIMDLNSSTISLKNVSKTSLGNVENVHLLSNSSDIVIDKIGENVSLNQKFGTLKVNTIISDFKNLSLNFEYAKATIPLGKLSANYTLDSKNSRIITNSKNTGFLKKSFLKTLSKYETSIKGDFSSSEETQNIINLIANFSTVNIN